MQHAYDNKMQKKKNSWDSRREWITSDTDSSEQDNIKTDAEKMMCEDVA